MYKRQGKTTAISVTMLITIAKTVSGGFGERLAFAASLYVCPLQNDGQPSSMLDRDWGGGEADPPDTNFQSPVWGSSSTSGGLNPPTPRQIERWKYVDCRNTTTKDDVKLTKR